MKSYRLFFLSLFLILSEAMYSFSTSEKCENGKIVERIMVKKVNSNTRSGSESEINAFVDDRTITVEVIDYTGDVSVIVLGFGGASRKLLSSLIVLFVWWISPPCQEVHIICKFC